MHLGSLRGSTFSAFPSSLPRPRCKPSTWTPLPRAQAAMTSVEDGDNGATTTTASSSSSGSSGGGAPSSSSQSSRMALAAKISAARTLARKLAEEKQAAAAAAQLVSQHAVDSETAAELVRSAEVEVAELAKEAAKADAMARAAVKAERGSPQLLELQRLKEENAALQELVMQIAADRAEAERRLKAVRQRAAEAATRTESESLSGSALTVDDLSSSATSSTTAQDAGAAAPASDRGGALVRAVEGANASGLRVTTVPAGPVAVGTTIRVLYNLHAGPLPRDSASPALKIGLNRWESQLRTPMERVPSLEAYGAWFAADVTLPKLLFRIDFVVEDASSGAVDNNGGRDFTFDLSGAPSAAEVTAARLALLDEAEAAAAAVFAAHEDALEAAALKAAEGFAKEARLQFVAQRRENLLKEARAVVDERRGEALPQKTATSSPGVFAWVPAPKAGATSTLYYNRASGPLADAGSVTLHVGYDGWWMKDKRVLPMRPASPAEIRRHRLSGAEAGNGNAGEEWWAAEVAVWNTAAVLDFAFANDSRSVWDNCQGADYHTEVAGAASGERLVKLVLNALDAAGAEEAARGERMAERRVLQRAATKAAAARRRRELQRRVLYTEPIVPQAGKRLKIFYNPDRTALRGRPDVYLRGGFNRWTHREAIGPVALVPAVPEAGGLGYLTADVDVPADAHTLDVYFVDSADAHGGFQDNNGGLDYHVPISGSTVDAPALRVAHVAAEMAPIAKAGGLGDVVTALGRAVQEEGHDVEVVLPKYDCIDYSQVKDLVLAKEFWSSDIQVKVWKGEVEGLPTTFLEPCNGLFWVGQIYTDANSDRHRFGTFCGIALHYLLNDSPKRPDVLHCHDWQSAPVAFLERQGVAAAFTIHNLNYGPDLIGGAMAAADVCTTVSPTYASEVSGHPAVAAHHAKFRGIRNGIDMDIWDPAADPLLPLPYSSEDVAEGKAAAKAELRARMGLATGDVPLVGCVTRLTHQKGVHLIRHAAWRAVERGAQFVLLGSAPDAKLQSEFEALAADLGRQYPDRARLWFAYDEPLSHLIYAGADMLLVPSMFEPCGLTQMIAMRYGTVPVVRRTGGLADTVFDVDDDEDKAAAAGLPTNGFSFDGADAAGMDYALNRALDAWYVSESWDDLRRRCMEIDWSWAGPAQDYLELYWKAVKK